MYILHLYNFSIMHWFIKTMNIYNINSKRS